MMGGDIDTQELRRRHRPTGTERTLCLLCQVSWPCDAVRLLDAYEGATRRSADSDFQWRRANEACAVAEQRAESLSSRLAEAEAELEKVQRIRDNQRIRLRERAESAEARLAECEDTLATATDLADRYVVEKEALVRGEGPLMAVSKVAWRHMEARLVEAEAALTRAEANLCTFRGRSKFLCALGHGHSGSHDLTRVDRRAAAGSVEREGTSAEEKP